MKIKSYLLLLSICSLLSYSCSSNEDITEINEISEKNIKSYRFFYMHYPQAATPGGYDTVTIEYDSNNRPIKRIGGLLVASQQSGFNYAFSNNVYNEVTYGNNNATIISKLNSSQGYTIPENKKYFEFENGKILKKIVYNLYENDTIQYIYNNQNRLSKRVFKKNNAIAYQSDIYYNQNGNVDSIVTRSPTTWNPITSTYEINFSSKSRVLETFKNYDNRSNPTKKLMIFDEIFLRSLSENNYNYYNQTEYNANGTILNFREYNWDLQYTDNNVDFSKK